MYSSTAVAAVYSTSYSQYMSAPGPHTHTDKRRGGTNAASKRFFCDKYDIEHLPEMFSLD